MSQPESNTFHQVNYRAWEVQEVHPPTKKKLIGKLYSSLNNEILKPRAGFGCYLETLDHIGWSV